MIRDAYPPSIYTQSKKDKSFVTISKHFDSSQPLSHCIARSMEKLQTWDVAVDRLLLRGTEVHKKLQ
jgi:hypothetical protein